MPTPPRPWVVGAPERPSLRRLRHLLALAAVALPLIAAAAAPAGAPVDAAASDPSELAHVTVVDGLTVHLGVTGAPDVATALADLDVLAGPLDRIVPSPDTPLVGPTTVVVERVTVAAERRHVELRATTVRIEDPDLLQGYVEVEEEGRPGVRIDTSLVMRVDGAVTSRLHLESTRVSEPVARVERVGTATRPDDTVWDALARCESSGRWDAEGVVDGRVVHRGGLQFTDGTWAAFRPVGFPEVASDASREQQIVVAERVLARQGWEAWPACSARLGLR